MKVELLNHFGDDNMVCGTSLKNIMSNYTRQMPYIILYESC